MTGVSSKAASQKRGHGEPVAASSGEEPAAREQVAPVMLRPKASQKECVEHIAEQMGIKRSQLDPTFYLRGALLTAVEKLGKEEVLGTWTRKEVAAFLKNAFTPLFELLYEQGELPLVFTLLISRGAAPSVVQPEASAPVASPSHNVEPSPPTLTAAQEHAAAEASLSLLSADAEIGLDGFPAGI